MAMTLERVVPWGRTRAEYCRMFDLGPGLLQRRILGCADGPASFQAELHDAGGEVISCDPIYQFSGAVIRARFEASAATILSQVAARPDRWVWSYHKDIDDLRRHRTAALHRFLDDYEAGRRAGRYQVASLPHLPYRDGAFDLALCSHFLFLYSEHCDADFHVASVLEMCRVAGEVRIFPIITLAQERAPHLEAVRDAVAAAGWRSEVRRVPYELQKGGNEMLVLYRAPGVCD